VRVRRIGSRSSRARVRVRNFGIGRTKLCEWIEAEKVKSVSLRERGIRLVSYDSLVELMERAARGECI
jgi:hypothetical protein